MMTQYKERLLLFGASGAIGGSIAKAALNRSWSITAVSRNKPQILKTEVSWIAADPLDPSFSFKDLIMNEPYTCVCWAQGANLADSVYDVEVDKHLAIYKTNCVYILITLRALLENNLLAKKARLCVISSIWQNLAKQSKLSYCMSKAALQGLVLSASADLAEDGHLINAVLPGALDTPMTRANLTPQQIDRLTAATKFGSLPQLADVASLVCYLCSSENTGITGQFIASDLGFSRVRII